MLSHVNFLSEGSLIKMEHKRKLSRKYLEHIRNQLEYLQSIRTIPDKDKEREENTFHGMLSLWSICEIVFLTGTANDMVIEDFLEWVNLTDPGLCLSPMLDSWPSFSAALRPPFLSLSFRTARKR